MFLTIDLPADAQARLEAESARLGITLDQLIAEFASRLPNEVSPEHRLSFVGIGASGRTEPFDIHRARVELVRPAHCDAFELIP